MKILVTGSAGFIGHALSHRLLAAGHEVVGLDNRNDYYPVELKLDRLKTLEGKPGYTDIEADLADADTINRIFAEHQPDIVYHLAAQAGVRYSLQNPQAYIQSNLVGFANILEACRQHPVQHLVYASSSSVYGNNDKIPFSVDDPVDYPVSLYAATKKSNELMAHSYSHLYDIPATGLRFFTVYGPWGRPDMAYFSFTKKILAGETIEIFNYGNCKRDFTYIDDIVDGLMAALTVTPEMQHGARHAIYNIGNHQPVQLMAFVGVLEKLLGKKAEIRKVPAQPGDVETTYADIDATRERFGYEPKTDIETGLAKFIDWYKGYYGV